MARSSGGLDDHFRLMNHQLAQLRSAWALARVTGRVLVMPAFTCGMDRVWFPHDGRFPGSDPLFTIPFSPCPMDHVRAAPVPRNSPPHPACGTARLYAWRLYVYGAFGPRGG